MTDAKIKTCPNCGNDNLCLHLLTLDCFWECAHCYLQGPHKDTEAEADNAWNALPRREEFYRKLMKLAEKLGCYTDDREVPFQAIDQITDLATKYAPRKVNDE